MGLLRKQTPEEKAAKEKEKLQKFINKYHLNGLTKEDLVDIQEIAHDYWGMGLLKFGSHFGGNSAEAATVDFLSIIARQNFIIIRKLNDILNTLNQKDKE